MSDLRDPLVFFQVSLYRTTTSSTGAMTYGAEALTHDPHAVLREIFPSFQIIVEWYENPAFFAIVVRSAPTLCWPPLFLSSGILRQNLPSSRSQSWHRRIQVSEKTRY